MDMMTISPFNDSAEYEYSAEVDSVNMTTVGTAGWLNLANSTLARPAGGLRHYTLVFKIVYGIGILGNLVAIAILRRGERRVRNRKHLLLMTSLATNDLIALVSSPEDDDGSAWDQHGNSTY